NVRPSRWTIFTWCLASAAAVAAWHGHAYRLALPALEEANRKRLESNARLVASGQGELRLALLDTSFAGYFPNAAERGRAVFGSIVMRGGVVWAAWIVEGGLVLAGCVLA